MARKIPDTPPPVPGPSSPGEVPKTGFYNAIQGPFGSSISVAGILLNGMQAVVNNLLSKADLTNKEFARLRDIQKKVDELMKLLTKIDSKDPLPPTLGAQIEAMIGKGADEPGEVGALIAKLETSGTRQTLNAQLAEVRNGMSVVESLQSIVQAIKEFKDFWVEVINSKGAILSTEEGRVQLRKLLLTLQTRMKFLGQILETAREDTPRGPFGIPLPGSDKIYGSNDLYNATLNLYGSIKEIFSALNIKGLPIIGGGDPLSDGGTKWDQAIAFLQGRMEEPKNPFGPSPGYGLPGLGQWGSYGFIDNAISRFGALEGKLSKIDLQTMIEEAHRKLREKPGTTDWTVEGYRDAVRAVSKLGNTVGQTTPDVMAELKATTDQISQLLQQLQSTLKIAYRTVDNSLRQIRPKG
jgi:hypothetical protein